MQGDHFEQRSEQAHRGRGRERSILGVRGQVRSTLPRLSLGCARSGATEIGEELLVPDERFLRVCPSVEKYIVYTGAQLIKFWLKVGDREQKRRFEARTVAAVEA